ncbi:5-formyltetrahydrofolate cyclo-ligase [Lentibacillus sediminis]|uniref:5-formyltetrahydrofolate cyclo-ligase n=1 Tax=Lentibacillus sediminis TaxID=1940529 RepID=UPI000C1BD115|nr:5-formyltetrahydrofolate cyclo-ligase [Lentibacillus sediminis]
MNKHELRRRAITDLQSIRQPERANIEQQLKKQLLASSLWQKSGSIGITVSRDFEWNTRPIIEAAWNEGKTVCVPRCVPAEREMIFHELKSFDQLKMASFKLLEPDPNQTAEREKGTIDFLIVPGLLFDKEGYRVGFGGGYYDRFLPDFPNLSASLLTASQLKEKLPREPFDIPVDYLITETGVTAAS